MYSLKKLGEYGQEKEPGYVVLHGREITEIIPSSMSIRLPDGSTVHLNYADARRAYDNLGKALAYYESMLRNRQN